MVQLREALDRTRRHILDVVGGLDEALLRRAALPSGWSPLELVRHLTLADERYWFSSIVGGEDLGWLPVEPQGDWTVQPEESAVSVVDAYRRQIVASNAVLDRVAPDEPPKRRDARWDTWGVDFPNVRFIVLHMIAETATHAGHLDAAVELFDGRQRLVVD
jgi:hypothetical protein